MKHSHALVLAAVLGICGAVLNFAYLASRARNIDTVEFIAVKRDAVVNRGERLSESSLMPVGIPAQCVGNLKEIAVLYEDLDSVKDQNVCRTLVGGSLLLRDDLATHPQGLELAKDENAMWIPVDSRAFVPSLVQPGDTVSFRVPLPPPVAAAPAALAAEGSRDGAEGASDAAPAGPVEIIGPFKVLALGNRLSDADTMRASKVPQLQENVLTIRVSKTVAGEPERAEKLWARLQAINFRQVGVILHARRTDKR